MIDMNVIYYNKMMFAIIIQMVMISIWRNMIVAMVIIIKYCIYHIIIIIYLYYDKNKKNK